MRQGSSRGVSFGTLRIRNKNLIGIGTEDKKQQTYRDIGTEDKGTKTLGLGIGV